MAASAYAFFLFSFQVHEKSILLPLLPVTLLGVEYPWMSLMQVSIAMFSMSGLLLKDRLAIPYVVLSLVYIINALRQFEMTRLQRVVSLVRSRRSHPAS